MDQPGSAMIVKGDNLEGPYTSEGITFARFHQREELHVFLERSSRSPFSTVSGRWVGSKAQTIFLPWRLPGVMLGVNVACSLMLNK